MDTSLLEPVEAQAVPSRFYITHPMLRIGLGLGLAVLGTSLFFDHPLGISVFLFALAIACTVPIANTATQKTEWMIVSAIALAIGIIPSTIEQNPLTLWFAVAGLAVFTVGITGYLENGIENAKRGFLYLLGLGLIGFPDDMLGIFRWMMRGGKAGTNWRGILGWAIPIGFFAIFLGLLSTANPLIESLISSLSFDTSGTSLSLGHAVTMLVLFAGVWPFVKFMPWPAFTLSEEERKAQSENGFEPPYDLMEVLRRGSSFLDKTTVLRSLVLFNLLFAFQTLTDLAYLWGGIALPNGVTYADYAHRGTYPLMITAILAGVFVLFAMRQGGPGKTSKTLRVLVYAWVGQTLLMVFSAMMRLELYVSAYSLTYLRVIAFAWMVLVAIGLGLIIAKIALDKNNRWLITGNEVALIGMIWVCSFIGIPGFIANFNVDHSLKNKTVFDIGYATSLGVSAIPAIDRYYRTNNDRIPIQFVEWRDKMTTAHLKEMEHWQAWTFRGGRLAAYLRLYTNAPTAKISPWAPPKPIINVPSEIQNAP